MPSGSYSINTSWYLDVNRLADHSVWAHGVMRFYSHDFGIALLAVVLVAAWWRARSAAVPARAVAGVLWAAGGTVVAWVIAHYGLKPLVGERRPYLALHHVHTLLARTHGFSFPSGHATVAGAVIVGLWLARRRLAATAATVLGLLLCFGRIYTGMHYPFDVLAGLVVGGVVVGVLWSVAVAVLTRWNRLLLASPLAFLVASRLPANGARDDASGGGSTPQATQPGGVGAHSAGAGAR